MTENGADQPEQGAAQQPARSDAQAAPEAAETLARVRDLLFGEAQRSQEQRTDDVERRLRDLVAAAEARLADGMRSARQELEEEARALRERVGALEVELARHGRAHLQRESLAADLEALARRLRGGGPDHAA